MNCHLSVCLLFFRFVCHLAVIGLSVCLSACLLGCLCDYLFMSNWVCQSLLIDSLFSSGHLHTTTLKVWHLVSPRVQLTLQPTSIRTQEHPLSPSNGTKLMTKNKHRMIFWRRVPSFETKLVKVTSQMCARMVCLA